MFAIRIDSYVVKLVIKGFSPDVDLAVQVFYEDVFFKDSEAFFASGVIVFVALKYTVGLVTISPSPNWYPFSHSPL